MTEMATEKAKVVGLIIECLADIPPKPGAKALVLSEDLALLGPDSPFDSMALVTLIVDVEQRLNDEYDVDLILASDRAMSRRHSPFRSVGAFAEYINELLAEFRADA